MSITHERMELINQMHNTSMSVIINDLYDIHGHATGNEVIIDIPID